MEKPTRRNQNVALKAPSLAEAVTSVENHTGGDEHGKDSLSVSEEKRQRHLGGPAVAKVLAG